MWTENQTTRHFWTCESTMSMLVYLRSWKRIGCTTAVSPLKYGPCHSKRVWLNLAGCFVKEMYWEINAQMHKLFTYCFHNMSGNIFRHLLQVRFICEHCVRHFEVCIWEIEKKCWCVSHHAQQHKCQQLAGLEVFCQQIYSVKYFPNVWTTPLFLLLGHWSPVCCTLDWQLFSFSYRLEISVFQNNSKLNFISFPRKHG